MRLLRLAAMFLAVALIVAASVAFFARRSELSSERDLQVEHGAAAAAASIGAVVGDVVAVAAAGDDAERAARAVADAGGAGVAVCAASLSDGSAVSCAGATDDLGGPAGDTLAGRVADEVASLDAGAVAVDGPLEAEVVRADGGVLEVVARGPSLVVQAVVDVPALVGGARDVGDVVVGLVRGAGAGLSDARTVEDRRVATASVGGLTGVVVVADVPADVRLPSDERWLMLTIFGLAVLLLVLAGATMLTEQRTLVERASIDPLTRLPNRSEFERRTEELLATARRTETGLCLLLFDLDGFKVINDTRGHQAGDDVLREVGRRLRKSVRESDIVARWGGDEFVLVMPGMDESTLARSRAAALAELIAGEPVGEDLHVGASVGIALFPRHGDDLAGLVEAADAAMYAAKRDGVTHRLAGVESSAAAVVARADDRRGGARVR